MVFSAFVLVRVYVRRFVMGDALMSLRLAVRKISQFSVAVLVVFYLSETTVCAASWEQQAERLQMVSASLLDAQPLLSVTGSQNDRGAFRVEGKAIVTVLPRMNATVGSKTEQPPQPPAHSIPMLEVAYQSPSMWMGAGVMRLWQGYLPADAGKQLGMNATCGQTVSGVSLGLKNDRIGLVTTAIEVGQQWGSSLVEGGITEIGAKDRFQVKSRLRFGAVTVTPQRLPSLWIQAQVTERLVAMHFEIPSDGTTFNLTDRSTIRGANAASQWSLGYTFGYGVQGALAYLNVPSRVSMPRVLLSYSAILGGRDQQMASVTQ